MLKGANTKQCSLDIVEDNRGLGRDICHGWNDKSLTWKENKEIDDENKLINLMNL